MINLDLFKTHRTVTMKMSSTPSKYLLLPMKVLAHSQEGLQLIHFETRQQLYVNFPIDPREVEMLSETSFKIVNTLNGTWRIYEAAL